ncbi:MAG: phospho-N-acetylmuramoyl-pentapeptide-transferase [Culicoidibacterales bacterium]
MAKDMIVLSVLVIMSLLFTIVLTYRSIPMLRNLKAGQSIREEGPKSHFSKTGTPTMGGLVFIFVASFMSIVATFILSPFTNQIRLLTTLSILGVFVGFGLVGFIDDYLKVKKKQNLGFSSLQKLLAQIVVTGIFVVINILPRYADGTSIFYIVYDVVLIVFMMLATTNAVNLTDGLDGLASGTMIFPLVILGFIGLVQLDYNVVIISFIVAATLFGFLVFNFHPAQIFMGDTGSLALGGVVSALAIFTGMRWLLILLCLVPVCEVLSVIIQVSVFKATKGKRRVFKMSPVHHHFELSGWGEKSVVYLFWTISGIVSVISFYIFYLVGMF